MENNRKIPFSPPDISEKEIELVAEALRSGWITTGPKTKLLEQKVAEFVRVNRAVCLNSQTACAEMALRVLEIGPGDEVIVPAYTYTASASIVCHVGATLIFVDTQKDSFEMDYDQMESLITEKTKAIIPVDMAGIPCNYERIYEAVENKKLLFQASNAIQGAIGRVAICADTAHAFGASRNGQMAGSIADFSSFSFHAVKNFTTAEGGALTWNSIPDIDDEEIYRKVQLLSLHGQNKDALAKSKLGAWEYDIIGPWYKCNMTDVLASIGLAQFERYESLLARRKEIIERYDAGLKDNDVITLQHYTDEYCSTGHLYLTRIPGADTEKRNEIISKMAELGVSCNVHYKPLPMMTAYKELGFDIKDFPNAYALYENEITLPLHTLLSDEDVDYVVRQYLTVLKEVL